jgi:hypothetical protein
MGQTITARSLALAGVLVAVAIAFAIWASASFGAGDGSTASAAGGTNTQLIQDEQERPDRDCPERDGEDSSAPSGGTGTAPQL